MESIVYLTSPTPNLVHFSHLLQVSVILNISSLIYRQQEGPQYSRETTVDLTT